jgi:pimeloyl-ACP methyl ester carboxylesterase
LGTLSRRTLVVAAAFAPALASRTLARPRAGLVPVDGGQLYYETSGRGPPVVLIHSAFMSLGMWDETAEALAASRTVIRFDMRGHGRSPFPKAPAAYYDDVRAIMDALEVPRADIVGSSLGGAVGFDFARAHPGRVRRLVLSGAAPAGGGADPDEGKRLSDMIVTARREGVAAGVEKWLALPMNASAAGPARERIRRSALDSPDMFKLRFWPVKDLAPPAMTRLAEVAARVLIISGAHDSPALRADAIRAARALPHARFGTFEASGHFPNLEEPLRFNAFVRRFLA